MQIFHNLLSMFFCKKNCTERPLVRTQLKIHLLNLKLTVLQNRVVSCYVSSVRRNVHSVHLKNRFRNSDLLQKLRKNCYNSIS